jgi:MFS family permease
MATAILQPGSRGETFRSLRIRNYRLFFTGQLLSMCGTWMSSIAQTTYVLFRLHGKGRELGYLSAATFTPILLFTLWAGTIADRSDKRKVLIRIQIFFVLVSSSQTILVLTKHATVKSLCVVAFLMGCGNAMEMPTRQAFLTELVGADDLPNAVGLNSALFNSGRVIGQAIGGVLVTTIGYVSCFGLNAASFVAILIGLFMMRTAELHPMKRAVRAKGQIRDGLRHVLETPVLATVIVLVFITGTLALNFQVFVPLLAKQVFHGGESTVAMFQVILGAGALTGSLFSAGRNRPNGYRLSVAAAVFGTGLAIAGATTNEPVTWIGLFIAGFSYITFMLTANSTLQLHSDPARRGRVMALYSLVFAGTTPFGAPLVGWVADRWSTQAAIDVGAIAAVVTGALGFVATRRRLLPSPNERAAERISTRA